MKYVIHADTPEEVKAQFVTFIRRMQTVEENHLNYSKLGVHAKKATASRIQRRCGRPTAKRARGHNRKLRVPKRRGRTPTHRKNR